MTKITPKYYGWEWSGDYYGPGLSDHLHALGVVAANYNSLEGILYSIFSFYFRDQERAGILFSQLRNNIRLDTLRAVAEGYESDPKVLEAVLYFSKCFHICSDNRNLLMHSIVDMVEIGDTILSLLKGAKNAPRDYKNLRFDAPTLRRTADEIWCLEHYGIDLVFFLLTRSGLLKETDSAQ
jgi:hypothetical protein